MPETTPTLITHVSWGRIEVLVGSESFRFKDCKLWPGGAVAWDWNDTGTRHLPGIQPEDLDEILEQDVDVMVLSRGMRELLHISPETEELLREEDIEYLILDTRQAVERFNELIQEGIRVGGIFHSTC